MRTRRKEKKQSRVLSLRIPEELFLRIKQQADDENRTVNNLLITYILADINFTTSEHKAKLEGKDRNRRRR